MLRPGDMAACKLVGCGGSLYGRQIPDIHLGWPREHQGLHLGAPGRFRYAPQRRLVCESAECGANSLTDE